MQVAHIEEYIHNNNNSNCAALGDNTGSCLEHLLKILHSVSEVF